MYKIALSALFAISLVTANQPAVQLPNLDTVLIKHSGLAKRFVQNGLSASTTYKKKAQFIQALVWMYWKIGFGGKGLVIDGIEFHGASYAFAAAATQYPILWEVMDVLRETYTYHWNLPNYHIAYGNNDKRNIGFGVWISRRDEKAEGKELLPFITSKDLPALLKIRDNILSLYPAEGLDAAFMFSLEELIFDKIIIDLKNKQAVYDYLATYYQQHADELSESNKLFLEQLIHPEQFLPAGWKVIRY